MLIDTHCHLNFKAFKKDLDQILDRAKAKGVTKIIIPGAKLDSSQEAVRISQLYPACFAAVGIHPHHAEEFTEEKSEKLNQAKLKKLTPLLKGKKTVAVGEIGLDRYQYKDRPPLAKSDIEGQTALFTCQLDLAVKFNLPVIIHSRQAMDDVIAIIENYIKRGKSIHGVFHCFEGNENHLNKAINLGFYVGFDGNITYEENDKLRSLVKYAPLNRILIETDAPFLTPVPFRYTRNEPSYLPLIAQIIADIHKRTKQDVAYTTVTNARKLFKV